jgi:hypothetical protein
MAVCAAFLLQLLDAAPCAKFFVGKVPPAWQMGSQVLQHMLLIKHAPTGCGADLCRQVRIGLTMPSIPNLKLLSFLGFLLHTCARTW